MRCTCVLDQTGPLLYETDPADPMGALKATGSWSTGCPRRGYGNSVFQLGKGWLWGILLAPEDTKLKKNLQRQSLLRGSQLQDDRQHL